MPLDSDISRLQHMVDAVREILEFVEGRTRQSLSEDRPLQHLVNRDLEILGEAASWISEDCRAGHPEIPWREMVDLRNRLVHAYFDVNLDIVWSTVQRDLPRLLLQLEALMSADDQ
jgi:uncharacterized protein with HEPN domain